MSRFAVPGDRPTSDQGWQTHQLTPSSDTCSSATLHDVGSPVSAMYNEDGKKHAYAYSPRSSDPLAAQHNGHQAYHQQAHHHAGQRHADDVEQQPQYATRQHTRSASYPIAPMTYVETMPQRPSQHDVESQGVHHVVEEDNGHGEAASWTDGLRRFRADWHASLAHGGALTQLLHACLAEFLGNFFISLPVALTIAEGFMIDGGKLDSDKFVNVALSLGVSVALSVLCFVRVTGTSLHSSVTVCMALFGRIAWWRVPFQLAAQCLGAFAAELVASAVYWNVVSVFKEQILASTSAEESPLNVLAFSTIFQTLKQYGRPGFQIFLAELVSAFLASIAIASLLDRVNPLSNLTLAAPVLGAFYAMHTLAFASASTMGNPAHDLGSRMACATLLGKPEACFLASDTANAFLTPILGMLIGFTVFFFFLSSGTEPSSKKREREAAAEAGASVRQSKRAFLRPFQYKSRSGLPGGANPHRRIVSFGNKMDHPQGFQNFVRLHDADIASLVALEQQPEQQQQPPRPRHPSPAPSVDSIRWAAARKSWRHVEEQDDPSAAHPAAQTKAARDRRSSVASGHWLIRSDSVGSTQNGAVARKPVLPHSGPSSEAMPMSAIDGHGRRHHFDEDAESHAL